MSLSYRILSVGGEVPQFVEKCFIRDKTALVLSGWRGRGLALLELLQAQCFTLGSSEQSRGDHEAHGEA